MSPRIVLVTGCVSGIGLATAERLARDPDQRFLVIATVISLDLKGDLVAAVGDALDKTVFIKEMDITKDEDISRTVDSVIKEFERIDVVCKFIEDSSNVLNVLSLLLMSEVILFLIYFGVDIKLVLYSISLML